MSTNEPPTVLSWSLQTGTTTAGGQQKQSSRGQGGTDSSGSRRIIAWEDDLSDSGSEIARATPLTVIGSEHSVSAVNVKR